MAVSEPSKEAREAISKFLDTLARRYSFFFKQADKDLLRELLESFAAKARLEEVQSIKDTAQEAFNRQREAGPIPERVALSWVLTMVPGAHRRAGESGEVKWIGGNANSEPNTIELGAKIIVPRLPKRHENGDIGIEKRSEYIAWCVEW